jgi:hypothetical protein
VKLSVERREWEFLLTLDQGEVPDVKLSYRQYAIRPDSVYLTIEMGRDDSARLTVAKVIGPRVLKNGLGMSLAETYSFADVLPEWLVPIVTGAMIAAGRDVSNG